ncbi:MAG: hypothetical protein JWS10_2858 [Cypionkella sp.]|uniref:hypothetical protein n=1 Tax=Cypionkella sp. TaxID=2811411 RepID=UPI0026273253|nr:hypothetical protein [Cypionkella sp.]MDB5660243.1 hypothetical protein [Cypionkella sp.]
MIYKVEFEYVEGRDQNIRWLTCDGETGVILDVGPAGQEIYADGNHSVDVETLELAKHIGCQWSGGVGVFQWPVKTIALDGIVFVRH